MEGFTLAAGERVVDGSLREGAGDFEACQRDGCVDRLCERFAERRQGRSVLDRLCERFPELRQGASDLD
jgi:hypothetical protein